MAQLLCHLWGDYILQSDWMARNKRSNTFAAVIHALFYSVCFIPLTAFHGHMRNGLWAFDVIYFTHFLIDRFGLARYLVWAKNFIAPWRRRRTYPETLERLRNDGHISRSPVFEKGELDLLIKEQKRSVRINWLTIIADNTLHLTINYLALKYM